MTMQQGTTNIKGRHHSLRAVSFTPLLKLLFSIEIIWEFAETSRDLFQQAKQLNAK